MHFHWKNEMKRFYFMPWSILYYIWPLMTFGHHHSQLAVLLAKYGSHHIWPLMTFDLHEVHHHLKLASAVLLTKFGGHSALTFLTPLVPGDQHVLRPNSSMRAFSPSPTHISNIIKVGHRVPEKRSGQFFE